MSVIVNGEMQPLPEPQTVAALLQMLEPAAPFAVARNGDFVPRAAYAECGIAAGDEIEIVHPQAGG
jgi:sulfur carrier protein